MQTDASVCGSQSARSFELRSGRASASTVRLGLRQPLHLVIGSVPSVEILIGAEPVCVTPPTQIASEKVQFASAGAQTASGAGANRESENATRVTAGAIR